MEAIFSENIKDVLFDCFCGWSGTELELDILTFSRENLVCCPKCKNDDVRVSNEKES